MPSRPDDTAGTGERLVAGMRERYKARTRDDGFHDEATGHWVRMLASVRPAGHRDVLALCDMVDALVAAVREAEAELHRFKTETWHCSLEDRAAQVAEWDVLWERVREAEARAEHLDTEREVAIAAAMEYRRERDEAVARTERAERVIRDMEWCEWGCDLVAAEALAAVSGEAPNDE